MVPLSPALGLMGVLVVGTVKCWLWYFERLVLSLVLVCCESRAC